MVRRSSAAARATALGSTVRTATSNTRLSRDLRELKLKPQARVDRPIPS
jgi:hypothetical protein